MTAALVARNTPLRAVDGMGKAAWNRPVNGGSILLAGTIGCLNTEGNAVPATAAVSLICQGRVETTVDNTAGADAAVSVDIRPGVFKWANSAAGDQITKAEIGKLCWLVDNQTVAKTSNAEARSPAGVVVDVESDGVWVAMGNLESVIGALALASTVVA
jgi:hypothetical protein